MCIYSVGKTYCLYGNMYTNQVGSKKSANSQDSSSLYYDVNDIHSYMVPRE